MKMFVAAIAGLLLAVPALADDGGSTEETAHESTEQAGAASGTSDGEAESQICRRIESDTGTRTRGSRRVCMTAREWREYHRQQR